MLIVVVMVLAFAAGFMVRPYILPDRVMTFPITGRSRIEEV